MAIEIECNDCGSHYRVADDKAGAKVKCRECGARIDVPADDDEELYEAPASRPRKPASRKRKKAGGLSTGTLLGIAGVAGAVAVSVLLIVIFSGNRNAAQVAQNIPTNSLPTTTPLAPPPAQTTPVPPTTATTPVGLPPTGLPTTGLPTTGLPTTSLPGTGTTPAAPSGPAATTTLPMSPLPASAPSSPQVAANPAPAAAGGAPATTTPPGRKFGGFSDGTGNDAAGAPDAPEAPDAPLPDNWTVKVDPPPADALLDGAKPITMKFPKGASHQDVLFPATPSTFVALGSNTNDNAPREIWNLATKSKVGSVTTALAWGFATSALSPDGQHLAISATQSKKDGVTVFISKTGKSLGELESGVRIRHLFFAGPSRLVAICNDKTAKVWKIPSGEAEHDLSIEGGTEDHAAIPSPGGNYLAVVCSKTSLKMFDLNTGELAGELNLPYGNAFFAGRPDALAFSPDGQELAMIMPSDISAKELTVFNVADGKMLTKVALNLKDVGSLGERVSGNPLEWFPDRSKLLWRGHFVLDAKIGGPVWRAPEEDGSSDAPRRLLGNDKILVVIGGRQNPTLKSAPIPLADIQASAQVVAQGGDASDVGLPPLTNADTSGYSPIPVGVIGAWSMKPDPTEPGVASKNSVPLPRDRPGLGGVFISRPSVGRAVAWFTDDFGQIHHFKGMIKHNGGTAPGGKGTCVIDVLDLTSGKALKSLPLNYQCTVLDVCPSGDAAVVRTTKPNEERLDVYQLPDGTPIAGWRPYLTEHFKGVTKAVLLDSQHCLTQNFQAVTYLWKLPECRALWRLDAGKNFCQSPGGKYLGFQVDSRYVFMDARSGELVAELPAQMPNIQCAFHPTGTHIATLGSDGVSHRVTIYDVATGKPAADFFVPYGNDAIHWCGDAHVLLDGKWLVDLKQQKNAWVYNLAFGTHALTQPDGRHWYVVSNGFNDPNIFLSSAQLPEKAVGERIDATKLPDESLLQPGMQINVQVNMGAAPPNNPGLANEVLTNFKAGLERNGFKFGPGGPYSFVVTTSQANTGENMQFRSIGIGGGNTTVPVVKVTCEVALLSNGQAVWKNTATMSNSTFGIVHLGKDEDITSHLSKQLWDQVGNHLKKFPVPAQAFPEAAGQGLGQSAFVAGGTQPSTR